MAHAVGYLAHVAFLTGAPQRMTARVRTWLVTVVVAVGCLCGASGVRAQAPVIQVVRFTVFAAKPVTDVAFVPRPGAAPQALGFRPTARSARYEYRGAMPLRFVDAATGEIVAEATIPTGVQDALLLFNAVNPPAGASEPGLRYQVFVVDDGAARHGPAGLAILNFSGLALTGTVNNQAVALRPGLNPPVTVGRSAKIVLNSVFKNRTYQSYAGTAPLGVGERALLVLFPPYYPGSREVQWRLLIDRPPGAPAR